jgi:hypothetical protein
LFLAELFFFRNFFALLLRSGLAFFNRDESDGLSFVFVFLNCSSFPTLFFKDLAVSVPPDVSAGPTGFLALVPIAAGRPVDLGDFPTALFVRGRCFAFRSGVALSFTGDSAAVPNDCVPPGRFPRNLLRLPVGVSGVSIFDMEAEKLISGELFPKRGGVEPF